MSKVATKIYGASEIAADSKVRAQIRKLQADGYGHYPVCVAKTQYSFSTDPLLRGAPSGHVVNIREVRLAAGAEFIVMICGDVMTMPGLPEGAVGGEDRSHRRRQGRRAVLGSGARLRKGRVSRRRPAIRSTSSFRAPGASSARRRLPHRP